MKNLKWWGAGFILTCSALTIQPAVSLGLGSIQVNSYLNEPLEAVLPLNAIKDVSSNEIRVDLASHEVFEKAGVKRAFYLTKLNFEVQERDGKPVVLVTSPQPIQDPFLSFIVEAKWGSGRVLREYTVLLDPPSAKKQVTHTPRKKEVTYRTHNSPVKTSAQTYGPVRHDDTLWQIAARLSKRYGAEIDQTMIAIARKNPKAFINQNINNLKRGVTLELPNEQEIYALTVSEAMAQVSAHKKAWQNRRKSPPLTPLKTQPKKQGQKVQKPLELVMPTAPTKIEEAVENKPQPVDTTKLENEQFKSRLLMIEEALDALKRTNQSLKNEQEDLLEYNKNLMDLLARKDQEINRLKDSLAESESPINQNFSINQDEVLEESVSAQKTGLSQTNLPESRGQQAQQTQAQKTSLSNRSSVDSEERRQAPEESSVTEASEKAIKTDQTQKEVPAQKVGAQASQPSTQTVAPITNQRPAQQEEDGWAFWLMLLVVVAGAGTGVYVAHRRNLLAFPSFELPGLGYLDKWRDKLKPSVKDTFDQDFEDQPEDNLKDLSNDLRTSKQEIEDAFSMLEEHDTKKSATRYDNSSTREFAHDPSSYPTLSDEQGVLSDVDVYMAYERYANAEQILLQFLEKHPEEYDAHIKLLEVYEISNELGKIQAHMETLPNDMPKRHPAFWQQMKEILKRAESKQDFPDEQSSLSHKGTDSKRSQNAEDSTHSTIESKSEPKSEPEPKPKPESEPKPESDQRDSTPDQAQPASEDSMSIPAEHKKGSEHTNFDLASKSDYQEEVPSFDLNQKYDLSLESDNFEEKPKKPSQPTTTTQTEKTSEETYKPKSNECDTKLALAQAYIDLGDKEGAQEHLDEVIKKGNPEQKSRAEALYLKLKEL